MAETFQLSVVYKAEDRAFLAALKRELKEAQKLDKVLTRLKQTTRSSATGSSGVSRMARDYDKLSQSIRRADREASRLHRTVATGTRGPAGRGAGSTGGMLGSSGPLAFMGRMVAPAAIGYGAYRMGQNYFRQWAAEDQATAYMRSIGGSPQLARQLAGLGNQYGKNRTDIILGGYQALSSGVSGDANVRSVVQNATALSATNPLASVEDSVKALTLAANAYAKNGVADFSQANMGNVKDMLARTVEKGVIEMPELTAQLGDPLSIAPMAGVTLKEVLATMGTMSLKGINAAEGATATKNLINKIIKPTDDSRGMAQALGVDLSKAGLARAGGLPQLMGQLVSAANKKGDQGLEMLLEVFPELRAAKAALAGFSDPAMWNDFEAALDNSAGAADRMAAVAQDNVSSQLKILGNNLFDTALRAGEASGMFGAIKGKLGQWNESLSGKSGTVYDASGPAGSTPALYGMKHNPYGSEANAVLQNNASLQREWDAVWANEKRRNPQMNDLQLAGNVMGRMNGTTRLAGGAAVPQFTEIMYNRTKLGAMNATMANSDPSSPAYGKWRSSFREGFLATTGTKGLGSGFYDVFNRVTDNPAAMGKLVNSWGSMDDTQRHSLGQGGAMALLVNAITAASNQQKTGDPEMQAFNNAISTGASLQMDAGTILYTKIVAAADVAAAKISSATPGSPSTKPSTSSRGPGITFSAAPPPARNYSSAS